jgi:hypothetical protein
VATGSRDFHTALNRRSTSAFGFAVPSVTLAVRDQINLLLSTLLGELVDGDPVISLSHFVRLEHALQRAMLARHGRVVE